MSLYDQLAFSSRPNFYLAAPSTGDQSLANAVIIATNNIEIGGQPIIAGHSSSFMVKESATLVLESNPIFKVGHTTEFILLAEKPTMETEVIFADNGNGIFLTPNGLTLRLNFNSDEVKQTTSSEISITEWHSKLHVVLTIGDNQAILTVNTKSTSISLDGILDTNISTTELGKNFDTGYYFLLDGFGIYQEKMASKLAAIDDNTSNHAIYASSVLNGKTVDFSTYNSSENKKLSIADFKFDSTNMQYGISYHVPEVEAKYVILSTSDDDFEVSFDLNNSGIQTFARETTVVLNESGNVLSFVLTDDVSTDFNLVIRVIQDADIFTHTPAFLLAQNNPVFPEIYNDSIVNCPRGTRTAQYNGTWLYTDDHNDPPQTIELVFKPREPGTIFSSSDGSVTTAMQSGYTMWLNGVSVSDLSTILMNQWNHLILTKVSASAANFQINSAGDAIDYLFMSAYTQILAEAEIEQLYSIAIGSDNILIEEIPLDMAEGSFDNGQPFQVFGNTWAIVGAGGN